MSPAQIVFRLGDTSFPETPVSGGSQTAASVGSAVHAAATALRDKLAALTGGRSEPLQSIAARHGEVEATAEAKPDDADKEYGMYAFGAQFAEVRVDAALGQMRVSRLVGVFDIGRALNARTARSQLIGGMVWGLGMALHENTVMDERLGRIVNNNLAEYHVPVNADVPAIEVAWLEGAARLRVCVGGGLLLRFRPCDRSPARSSWTRCATGARSGSTASACPT